MGRRPSVFVRPVSMEESRKQQRISRTANDPVILRRAMVVLMSAQGQTVKDIAVLMHAPGRRIVLLTVFRKTRMREEAEVRPRR